MKLLRLQLIFIFTFISIGNCFSQVVVTPGVSATTLATTLAGSGVAIFNITDTCPTTPYVASGLFTATGTLLSMSNGILLTNGKAAATVGAEGPLISYNDGGAGDPSVASLLPPGTATFDACMLEFDIVPTGDTLSFYYQFGSEEYRNAVCSEYTDVFAFFISGPGIPGGVYNMALVPGTNIPVEINSVNNGTPGTVGGATLSNCTSLGPGSPFTAYYIDNTGGPDLTYRGFTDKFRAFSAVTACDTYHLKLTVVDAGDAEYDSGVWLEGGSLSTNGNSYSFDLADSIGATIDGMDHTIVKGCSSTNVTVIGSGTVSTTTTITLGTSGTAVSGVDYAPLPSSLTIPAGDSTVTFTVNPLVTAAAGAKTLVLYITSTVGCASVTDSLTINILDTPSAHILTSDTSICPGQSVHIMVNGSAGLTYNWTPATYLDNPALMEPTSTPTAPITYTMTATLPGSGCAPIVRTISINIDSIWANILTSDTTICPGQTVHIIVDGGSGETYSWSPGTFLDSTNVQDPTSTPTSTITYTMTASLAGVACPPVTQTITISMSALSASMLTADTTICAGDFVHIMTNGAAGLTYNWSPAATLDSTTVPDPVATPITTTTYSLVVTSPGSTCPPINEAITVTVDSAYLHILTSDTTICVNQNVTFNVLGGANQTYSWTPTTYLNNPTIIEPNCTPTAAGMVVYTLTASSSACPALTQTVSVTAVSVNVAIATPSQTICPSATLELMANGTTTSSAPSLLYNWTPGSYLSNAGIQDPMMTAPGNGSLSSITYTVTGTDPFYGCTDTASVTINVSPIFQVGTSTANKCIGNSVILSVTVNPTGDYNYEWYYPDSNSASGQYDTIYNLQLSNAGIYTVTVTDANNCPETATETVNIGGSAVPNQIIIPQVDVCQYTTAKPLYISNYENLVWYTSPSDTTTQTYTFTPPIPNTDTVQVYTIFAAPLFGYCVGNPVAISVNVMKCCDGVIFVPDAFTPGGTMNTTLSVIAPDYIIDEFRIFNRWGQCVFNATTEQQGWDGTFQGQPAEMGTYFYTLTVTCRNSNASGPISKKGDITLIR